MGNTKFRNFAPHLYTGLARLAMNRELADFGDTAGKG